MIGCAAWSGEVYVNCKIKERRAERDLAIPLIVMRPCEKYSLFPDDSNFHQS